MDLTKINEMIQSLINKTEDKESIGTLGSLSQMIKEQEEKTKKDEEQYLNEISKWRDCYKESILKGGFKSKEASKEADPVVEDKIPTFDELLSKFAEK